MLRLQKPALVGVDLWERFRVLPPGHEICGVADCAAPEGSQGAVRQVRWRNENGRLQEVVAAELAWKFSLNA